MDTNDITPNGSFILPHGGPFICVGSSMLSKVYSYGWLSSVPPNHHCMSLLMLQLPIIILVSKTVHSLLRPLNQPRFVCDVITGLILGKSGLGASKLFWNYLFPRNCALVQETLAMYGIMFYLFLTAVKADPWMVVQSGKKAAMVGAASHLLPFVVTNTLPLLFGGDDAGDGPQGILRSRFYIFLSASISVTAAPVIGDTLADLGILDTELGRLGMSSAIISDFAGWFFMGLFIFFNQSQAGWRPAIYAMLSMLGMAAFIAGVLAPYMRRIIRNTPPGAQVRKSQLALVMISALVVGCTSDFIGVSFMVGALMFGLFVPHGPPLGSALVERLEVMAEEVLLPLLFTGGTGLVDIWALKNFCRYSQLVLIILAGYTAKLVAVMMPALYCRISFLKAFLLGLIMNFRGLMEMLTLIRFKSGMLLDEESYTVLMLSSAAVTAVAAPLVGKLYNPLTAIGRPVTIQKLKTYEEFRVLSCFHNKGHVSIMLNLLEASCSPLCAYVLHIVELAGQACSALIPHRNKKGFINPQGMSSLFHDFINYEQDKRDHIFSVQPFTTVIPFKTMHHDILALAAQKHIALILLPFLRGDAPVKPNKADLAMRSITTEILAHAPCSVGILVHRGLSSQSNPDPRNFHHHVGVFFWGGPDDREALMYASRMACHPGVNLTIVRFMPDPSDTVWQQEDEITLGGFKILNSGNDRIVFEEIMVNDLQETFSVIRSKGHKYDLIVVGRQQEGVRLFKQGLEDWIEFPDLGVVGDMMASSDFKCSCSVLVVQQHRTR